MPPGLTDAEAPAGMGTGAPPGDVEVGGGRFLLGARMSMGRRRAEHGNRSDRLALH